MTKAPGKFTGHDTLTNIACVIVILVKIIHFGEVYAECNVVAVIFTHTFCWWYDCHTVKREYRLKPPRYGRFIDGGIQTHRHKFTQCNQQASYNCWYNDEVHAEDDQVFTNEPCLNCTCSRNALLCYLRVCPKLPNPPPAGCILLHRYRTCCPELICTDFLGGGNSIEARSDPEENILEMPVEDYSYKDACFLNGSVYGPGSAMHSSSFCEYCYCLGGKQICVKPKCLLPLEGCIPIYDKSSCCPVKYDCGTTKTSSTTTTTTTTEMERTTMKDGCAVDGHYYTEGSKVVGVGHSACDNCYCLRGLLRCEPLSCAPPLLGCTPVIKPGKCCAASYNCNGTIDIDPEPNYGYHPTVSKEYAKLRKEVQKKPDKLNREGVVTVAPLYVLSDNPQQSTVNKVQHRNTNTFGTTRHFSGIPTISSTIAPSTTPKAPDKNKGVLGMYYATKNYEYQNTNYKRVYSTTLRTEETNLMHTKKNTNALKKEHKHNVNDFFTFDDISILSIVDSLLDGRLYRQADNNTKFTSEDSLTNLITNKPEQITLDGAIDKTTTEYLESTTPSLPSDIDTTYFSTQVSSTTEEVTTESNEIYPITVKTVIKSSDCIDSVEENLINTIDYTTILPIDPGEVNELVESEANVLSTTTEENISSTTETNTKNKDPSELKTRTRFTPEILAILNQTKSKKQEDYDYDYNESTLPPSLPNLKIIPFLAADAVDVKTERVKESPVYVAEKSNSNFEYDPTYFFSSPEAPQGGFVPKDSLALDNFYENVVSLTISPQIRNCISNGEEIPHGLSVASDSTCTTCACFFGTIVCRKPNCPPPNSGCRQASEEGITLCCPNYICDDPTVLLLPPIDRIDIPQEIVTVAEGILHPVLTNSDPFKDVIKTERAPNLESLIGDMIFQRLSTSTPSNTYISERITNLPPIITDNRTTEDTTSMEHEESFGLDAVLQFVLGKRRDTTTESSDSFRKINMTTPISTVEENSDPVNTNSSNSNISVNKNITLTHSTISTNFSSINRNSNSSTSSIPGVGLLKLAGCNIYGRMYRVGRIISELSGPCLECKCTEVGVQCKSLMCTKS